MADLRAARPPGLSIFFSASNDGGTIASLDILAVQSARRLTSDFEVISRSNPWHRVVIGRIYHHTVKFLFRLRARDVDCDFRLMRREIFDRVKLENHTGVICLEMMRKIQDAGFRVVKVPVHHYHRLHGRAQFFNFKRVFWTGIDVVRLSLKIVVLGRGRTNPPVLFRNPIISGVIPPESTKP